MPIQRPAGPHGIPGIDHTFTSPEGDLLPDYLPTRDNDGNFKSETIKLPGGPRLGRNPLTHFVRGLSTKWSYFLYETRLNLYNIPREKYGSLYYPLATAYVGGPLTACALLAYGLHLYRLRYVSFSVAGVGQYHIATRRSAPQLVRTPRRHAMEELPPGDTFCEIKRLTAGGRELPSTQESAPPILQLSQPRQRISTAWNINQRAGHTTQPTDTTKANPHDTGNTTNNTLLVDHPIPASDPSTSSDPDTHSATIDIQDVIPIIIVPPIVVVTFVISGWQFVKYFCGVENVKHFGQIIRWLSGTGPKPASFRS